MGVALTLAPWDAGSVAAPVDRVVVVPPDPVVPPPRPDERPRARVRGRIIDSDGHPVVGAVAKLDAGQGAFAAASKRGGVFDMEAPQGHHLLYATRLVGRDEVFGPPMLIELRDEGVAGLDLTLPLHDTVGVGVVLDLRGDDIVITWAQEGRAAADAGLRDGDQLVAIDGEVVKRMGLLDVERLLQGVVGTTVMLTVRGEDAAMRAVLVRRRLASQDHVPPDE